MMCEESEILSIADTVAKSLSMKPRLSSKLYAGTPMPTLTEGNKDDATKRLTLSNLSAANGTTTPNAPTASLKTRIDIGLIPSNIRFPTYSANTAGKIENT
jgi:hypothetical protein